MAPKSTAERCHKYRQTHKVYQEKDALRNWKVTNIYHVLFHYLVVKFSGLYKSVLLFTIQWKLVAIIFPQNYLLKPTF